MQKVTSSAKVYCATIRSGCMFCRDLLYHIFLRVFGVPMLEHISNYFIVLVATESILVALPLAMALSSFFS